ncbi:MAG: acyl-CoA dehydrogenase family protein [Candidatus Geothermarchaeales archaeon]
MQLFVGGEELDFSLSEEEELLQRTVKDFLTEHLVPRSREIDKAGRMPRDLLRKMGRMGLLGITVSKEFGGSEASFVEAALVAEEIGRADMSMATAVFYLVEAGWGYILGKYGALELKDEVLPAVTSGEAFLGIASTEPGGGSDILSMRTTVEQRDDLLVMNGEKTFISGVVEAATMGGGFLTLAKSDPTRGHSGFSICFLPVKDMPGVSTTRIEQMGREGISNGALGIDDVKLPKHYLVGDWNRGFYYAMEGFGVARVLVSAACVGAAERALQEAIRYVKERQAFGRPIGKFEGVQFPLVEDHARIDSVKLLVLRAAWMQDRHREEGRFSQSEINEAVAKAKLEAVPAAFKTIRDVMEWHGAYGYTKEAGLEMGLRGITSYLVGAEGSQNMMKLILAREILGKEYLPYR